MTSYSLFLLSRDPLVAATYSGDALKHAAERLAAMADGAAAHLLIRPAWDGLEALDVILPTIRAAQASAPNLMVTVLTATQTDDLAYRAVGLDSLWCNHNAFIDERLFAPDLDAEKRFDAVYNGRLAPMKRHELAAQVPRMAVITNAFEVSETYAQGVIAGYQDLAFINYQAGAGVRPLKPPQVREVLTQSRCGLALSAIEGAMYASAEYLLCGLPVVTTPSVGGRDVFFNHDYVDLVEPTPEAVTAGAVRLTARAIDPLMIRRRTLERMMPHRARLIMRLSAILQRDLFAEASQTLWLPCFTNKLEQWRVDQDAARAP